VGIVADHGEKNETIGKMTAIISSVIEAHKDIIDDLLSIKCTHAHSLAVIETGLSWGY